QYIVKFNVFLTMFDKDYLEKIRIEKEKWEEKLKESKERDVKFVTDSEIPIKRLYTPLDVKGDYLDTVNFPGQEPFTRGVYPSMYRGRLWTMRLFSGHGTPEETNLRWKYLYENGAGKTTTIRLLTGIFKLDDQASIEIFNEDITKNPNKYKMNFGIVPEVSNAFSDYTVWQNLNFSGGIYGISKEAIEIRAKKLLNQFDLIEKRHSKTKTLS
ncbi:unnamed protein product, partial [marine sediment metagenome]